MLSDQRIEGLFYEYLDEDITVIAIDPAPFVEQAKAHPYVRLQIQMGIYSDDNIVDDFLSPARAHPDVKVAVICPDIFRNVLVGIPDGIAEDYVRNVAVHEAHHFHTKHEPVSAADHARNELGCIAAMVAAHPELDRATKYVEAHSPVYRRVYERMATIENRLKKGITQ